MPVTPLEIALLFAGLLVLVAGAESLVRGASHLAETTGISPLVVGLTVVAFGTSAPELAVSLQSVADGRPDLAVGNAVGSNIFNVLMILGLAAAITPLKVAQRLVRFDVPLMIVVSAALFVMASDGRLSRSDGLLLFLGIVAYTVFAVTSSRKASAATKSQYAEGFGRDHTATPQSRWLRLLVSAGMVVGGLVLLVLGARWLVNGSTAMARGFGVSELVIGLTVVAGGTSLPELATSVMASIRGQRDIAVGNVVGSNLFNILCVLGASSVIAPAGIPVAPGVLALDLPVMIAVAVACLPILFTGHRIDRWEGFLFLGYYAVYTIYLIMHASHGPLLDEFRIAILWFALPLTAITMTIALWRSRVRHRVDGDRTGND